MADFEEKMNQILSSPEAMEQIMSLANSLSGTQQPKQATVEHSNLPAQGTANAIGDLAGIIDPNMMSRIMSLLSVYQQGEDDKTQLLNAMKPFLRQERQQKLDQAIRITRLSRVIKAAMGMLRGDGHV